MTVVDPIRDDRGWAFREGSGAHAEDHCEWIPVSSSEAYTGYHDPQYQVPG